MAARMPLQGDRVELLGLFGSGIAYSYSPLIHEAALRATERDGRYVLWPVTAEDLAPAMRGAYLLGVRGANVTTPHKAAAARAADSLSPSVRRVGAANTLARTAGGWEAHNTDVAGFWQPIDKRGAVVRQALVLGTGGAASAVVAALLEHGARAFVAGRDPAKAARLAREMGAEDVPWPAQAGPYDLVVNATTVGRATDESPLAAEAIPSDAIAYDLVYAARPTMFLRLAAERGCAVIGGEEMLLEQAALSWQIWFAEDPPRASMRRALQEAMQGG